MIDKLFNELRLDIVPCHIDPLPENFIKSGNDRIYIIDWEYSGNYDSVWDIAAVCLECNFTEDEENLFLNEYYGDIETKMIKEKILIHKIIQDMFWCTWAIAKVARGDDYLIEYSKFKFERVQKLLSTVRF